MILKIECRINADGQWWDIVTVHDISVELSPRGKADHIKKLIKGLKTVGIISRVGASIPPALEKSNQSQGGNGQSDATQAAFGWPAPHCAEHHSPMKVSGTQMNEESVAYYCTKKNGDGYCKGRATVSKEKGTPEFWSVK